MNNKLKGGGVMGQTSAGLTWPVKTHVGAWDDCYDKPCKLKECNWHLWTRLWPTYHKWCRSRTSWMTKQHKLHNQRGSQIGCAMEEGNMSQGRTMKIKLHHLHCRSELLYKRLFTLKNFTLWGAIRRHTWIGLPSLPLQSHNKAY